MLLRHNEWSPSEVAESTRRRMSFLPASMAGVADNHPWKWYTNVAQAWTCTRRHHGLRVMGLAERQEETREAAMAICDLHERFAGGLAAGMGGDARGDATGSRYQARREGAETNDARQRIASCDLKTTTNSCLRTGREKSERVVSAFAQSRRVEGGGGVFHRDGRMTAEEESHETKTGAGRRSL